MPQNHTFQPLGVQIGGLPRASSARVDYPDPADSMEGD